MRRQVTRDNHYVPKWYQKGFQAKGHHKLHVLNLHPTARHLPNGQTLMEVEVEELGVKLAFQELDLYTTCLGEVLNDDIETFLFGMIDKSGADAVRAWISGDPIKIHRKFKDFFEYMDAQRLRTPKGLDWIFKQFRGLPQLELMRQMQALRLMHCTMWSESVREIVSAAKSPVKFVVSDHPVTIYHSKLTPNTLECQYPSDPAIDLVGSQTIFALDANHCLILTHLEYAEDPTGASLLSRRTNARYLGSTLMRTDTLIRSRDLSESEVHAINLVLKLRAKKYIAASDPAWLYPEKHCLLPWEGIATILLPRNDLWRFGGEVYIGYKDGTSSYFDQFGRTSKSHEFLRKQPQTENLEPDAQCGCGSGIAFRDCCADLVPQRRPSWQLMGIRERNLMLVRGITHILNLNEKTDWLAVRRSISLEQVRQIHKLFAALWPTDTRLIELLPVPQGKRSRALYLGVTDARTAATSITGMLAYVDELVVAHPFVNANGVRPEFSPLRHPAKFKEQTLRSVFLLLALAPAIGAGRIHLIADPFDYDTYFRSEILAVERNTDEKFELGPIDEARAQAWSKDEEIRAIKRLPPAEMKAYILRHLGNHVEAPRDATLDALVRLWKQELEADPLASLDPLSENSEFKVVKGFSRETGLFLATLTGSFIYTDSDTQWARLHETDGLHAYEPDPEAKDAVHNLSSLTIEVPTRTYQHQVEPPCANETRALLRRIALALQGGGTLKTGTPTAAKEVVPSIEKGLLTFKLRASVPLNGFERVDVSRLVLMFGRHENVAPVQLAVFLEPSGHVE